MLIKVNFADDLSATDFDNVLSSGTDASGVSGTVISGLTDYDTSTTLNASLLVNQVFDTAYSNTTYGQGDTWGYPRDVWEEMFTDTNSTPQIEITGPDITIGQSYDLTFAYTRGNFTIPTRYTVNNGNSVVYTSSGTVEAQSEPVTVTESAVDDGAGNGTLVVDIESDDGSGEVFLGFFTITEAAGPSITSATDSVGSTADRVTDGQNATIQFSEAVTVTGVELQSSAGTYVATLPIQSSTTDSVTVQGARGELRYGDTDNKIVATLDDSSTVEYTGITLAAPSGTFWVNGSNPDTTSENSVFFDTVSAPSGGYQLAWRDPNDVAGTTTTEKQNLIDSTGKVADIAQPGEVPVDGYDETDGSWTGEVIYTAELDDVSGIRRTLRDRLGNVQANLADLRVQVQKAFPSGVAPVFTATNEATDGSGVLLLDEPSMNLNAVTGESLGTTDGSGALSGTLASAGNALFSEVEEFSFSATIGAETIVDDGQGSLHLEGDSGASRGTITYSTGAFSITGASASTSASGDYSWRQSELHVTLTSANGEDVGGGWFTVIDTTTADESLMRGETP